MSVRRRAVKTRVARTAARKAEFNALKEELTFLQRVITLAIEEGYTKISQEEFERFSKALRMTDATWEKR